MLHSCDAGEKSIITAYAAPYISEDSKDVHSKTFFIDGPPRQYRQDRWNPDGMPAWSGRILEKHIDKMVKPFETMLASGHYTFSKGHLLNVAPHDVTQEN